MGSDIHPGAPSSGVPSGHPRATAPGPGPQQALEEPPLEYRRWTPPAAAERSWRPVPVRRGDERRRRVYRGPARWSPERRFLTLVVGVLVVFGGVAIGAATWTTKHIEAGIDRVADVFPTGERPAPAEGGLTFLVVGRDPVSLSNADGLADSLMLVHVSGGRSRAQVVNLPVYGQARPGGPTLDQSFSRDGPPQLIADVEGLTGVRIDHYLEVDFTGFQTVTDAVGGVDVDVPEPYSDEGFDFPAGPQHLDGDEALAYVRDSDEGVETGSALRQQLVISALFERVSQQGLLTDLGRLTATLDSLADALRVDDTLGDTELLQLAWSLRGLSRLDFVTAPVAAPTGPAGLAAAPFDPVRSAALWGYLRDDALADHLAEFR